MGYFGSLGNFVGLAQTENISSPVLNAKRRLDLLFILEFG